MRLNIKELYGLCQTKDDLTDIFVSSDYHANHKAICIGSTTWSNPEENCRDFANEIEMTDTIVKNTNSIIRENDIFIHLGDLAFGKGNAQKLIDKLNCKNIILLSGNHNHEPINSSKIRLECDYLELGFTKKVLVCMFHYPIAIWNEQHRFSMCLHGHSHQKYKGEGRIKDMDINGNNMFPYKLTDVVKELLSIPMVNNKGH